jgi:hypothetical protein
MMILGRWTSSSSLRPMQALSGHSQTLLVTIGFQFADKKLEATGGVRVSGGVACLVRNSLWSRVSMIT